MYTQCYYFRESTDEDSNVFHLLMEEFDKTLANIKDSIRHVTHATVVVPGGVQHYYTIFIEEKHIPEDSTRKFDNPYGSLNSEKRVTE